MNPGKEDLGQLLEEVVFECGFEGLIGFEGQKMGLWEEGEGAENSGPMKQYESSKKDELQ